MAHPRDDEKFSNAEAARRTEAALRAAFATPHKTYEESKIGKRRAKPKASPGRRKPVKKSGR
jgi:hypothetical protein